MARKKKRLPKGFGSLLESGDLAAIQAVFDKVELDAQDGRGGPSALGMYGCPTELAGWLIDQGATVDFVSDYGHTPLSRHISTGNAEMVALLLDAGARIDTSPDKPSLHEAAGWIKPDVVRLLLDRGADPNGRDGYDETALERALAQTRNADIPRMTEVAQLLLQAGATVTDDAREATQGIGEEFEFHRSNFNADSVDEVDAALRRLYELMAVDAAPTRREHDGTEPIVVEATHWREQFEELWGWLIPSSGAAATVQGEVLRIAGRVRDEQYRNGGANWDRGYGAMLSAWADHVGSGTPLGPDDLSAARSHVAAVKSGHGPEDSLDALCELSVTWVLANPEPMRLSAPPYDR